MDEHEFNCLLQRYPVVRPRDYHADSEPPKQSTSHSAQDEVKDWQNAWDEGDKKENQGLNNFDAFWEKIKIAAERKVGAAEAEKFCKAFQRIHKKLVYEELSLDAARSFVNSSSS